MVTVIQTKQFFCLHLSVSENGKSIRKRNKDYKKMKKLSIMIKMLLMKPFYKPGVLGSMQKIIEKFVPILQGWWAQELISALKTKIPTICPNCLPSPRSELVFKHNYVPYIVLTRSMRSCQILGEILIKLWDFSTLYGSHWKLNTFISMYPGLL